MLDERRPEPGADAPALLQVIEADAAQDPHGEDLVQIPIGVAVVGLPVAAVLDGLERAPELPDCDGDDRPRAGQDRAGMPLGRAPVEAGDRREPDQVRALFQGPASDAFREVALLPPELELRGARSGVWRASRARPRGRASSSTRRRRRCGRSPPPSRPRWTPRRTPSSRSAPVPPGGTCARAG